METINHKKMDNANETSGFVVPDNYFDELSSKVASKTYSGNQRNIRNINKRIILAAASVIILLGTSMALYVVLSNPVSVKNDNIIIASTQRTETSVKSISELNDSASKAAITEKNDVKEETVDNAIIEVAEEMNLTDEELIEFAELLEI